VGVCAVDVEVAGRDHAAQRVDHAVLGGGPVGEQAHPLPQRDGGWFVFQRLARAFAQSLHPAAERYGMGVLVWGPLGQGMLTGRARSGRETDLVRGAFFKAIHDERRLDAVEPLLALAEDAGVEMTHMAMAFAIAHRSVTSALIGPRTAEHLDDLLAGLEVRLTDGLLDRIDEIVPPGTDVGTLDQAFVPAPLQHAALRRRPLPERAAV
jgi:hypothetical protein